ncbi:MAG: DinB family protein [Chloroflexi bacterium]|nr:DinB family protein [Chloroflexota bacterium]
MTTDSTSDGPTTDPESARPPRLVRLLWDAYDEVERVAGALPTPGQGRAIGRLNAGSWIVAHVAQQQEAYWCTGAQGLEPDEWLAGLDVGFGSEPSVPNYAESLAAFGRVRANAIPYLRSLRREDLNAVMESSGSTQTVADLLVRSIGHLFVHTGELATIASLVGAPDLGAPGRLTHSTASPPRAEG